MPIPPGIEVYNADISPVVARGVTVTEAELGSALQSEVAAILRDDPGQDDLTVALSGLADTDFADDSIRRVLSVTPAPTSWRVGEAIAEAFLIDHRDCEFPWPMGRDLRNPNASPAGTDLVGFRRVGVSNSVANYRLAFGEVKTSYDSQVPPSVLYGRHGLIGQMESLRDSTALKDNLLRYLTHHARHQTWEPAFRSAAVRYLNDPCDVCLFGILVRDTGPDSGDLSIRAGVLAAGCPTQTNIELRAIYLPPHTIEPTETMPPPASKLSLGARALAALTP